MNPRTFLTRLAVCCLLFFADRASAQDEWEPLVLQIIHHSMDETFDTAHVLADSFLATHPTRPEPYFYKATVFWRQGMNDRSGSKYDDDILAHLGRSIEASENWIKHEGETAESFLWLGNAYGLRTGLRMLRREVFKGVIDGIEGRTYLDEAVAIDPDLVDANFGIGLSDYILSRNPTILRAVQRLFDLPSGDRRGGLRRLDEAIEGGTYNRIDAESARAYVDLYYEADAPGAHARLLELLDRFPNSLDYRIRLVDCMVRLQMEHGQDHASAMVDSTTSVRRIAFQRKWQLFRWREIKLTFVHGLGHFLQGNHERALPLLMATTSYSRVDDNWLIGPAELMLGKIADLSGRRDDAKEHYRNAERHDDVWGSHDEARRYQIQAYTGEEPESRPVDYEIRYPERP